MKRFTATREIGIDAGHRVTNHESKCRNLHGHRYTVSMTITGNLQEDGSSQGMVEDFGFMKDLLMQEVDEPCDHGTILWIKDKLVETLSYVDGLRAPHLRQWDNQPITLDVLRVEFSMYPGSYRMLFGPHGKLYIVDFVPTAENLAQHWYERIQEQMVKRSPTARLDSLRVDETPNAYAIYSEGTKE